MNISSQQHELMKKHLELVIEANKNVNLTRVDTFESGMILHIEDSLAALPEFLECYEGPYADLGTGGGFPGMTISIATGRKVLLVDSVRKKTAVLDDIAERLGLSSQIGSYTGRIEELSLVRAGEFQILTARALAALPSLIELASPLLTIGGRIICYKSIQYHDELDWALSIQEKLGMKHISTREFELSDNTPRSIIVFEKASEPLIKIPRRIGMAQKRPYK